jgi:CheY-like chemotaxis protein
MDTHILVVDDDPRILNLESLRLRRLGHTVTTCETAEDALDTVRQAPDAVDLVIADYKMPGRGGLHLAHELADNPATAGVPIVMMTGYREEVTEDEVRRVGVDVLLTKPVEQGELENVLATLL